MKFAKRLLSVLLAAALLAALTACGGAPAASGNAQGSGTGEKQIKLQWWVADPESWCAGYREIVRVYEEAHPNIKIDFATYPENMGEKMKAAQAAAPSCASTRGP